MTLPTIQAADGIVHTIMSGTLFFVTIATPYRNMHRCITEGNDRDWVEEQNFSLVIIFGLSTKPLATELDENPNAIYVTDAQGRTALDWAAARSQFEDVAILLS